MLSEINRIWFSSVSIRTDIFLIVPPGGTKELKRTMRSVAFILSQSMLQIASLKNNDKIV